MDLIKKNSNALLTIMREGCKYTYSELLRICGFTETQLCYAIMSLLKEGKICQYRESRVVYELIS